MRSRLVRLVILVLSLVFSGLISASPVENGAVTTSYDQAPTAKTVSPRMPITVVDTANLTDVTNPTQIANLSKRLDPTAHHLLIGECQKMARHRPMCCRHGYGSHHHECRLVYEKPTMEPQEPATYYACDKDFNHAYCCLDTLLRTGWHHDQWHCPFHLIFRDMQVNWGADRILF